MISHKEYPKDTTKKCIKLINGFSETARYKINLQKNTCTSIY